MPEPRGRIIPAPRIVPCSPFILVGFLCRTRQAVPNSLFIAPDTPDLSTPLLALFSTRDIEPREELSFDYSGDVGIHFVASTGLSSTY